MVVWIGYILVSKCFTRVEGSNGAVAYEWRQGTPIHVNMRRPNWLDGEVDIPQPQESAESKRIASHQLHWTRNPPLWHLRRSFSCSCALRVISRATYISLFINA